MDTEVQTKKNLTQKNQNERIGKWKNQFGNLLGNIPIMKMKIIDHEFNIEKSNFNMQELDQFMVKE